MGCYIIFAQSITNERAFLLADLCARLSIFKINVTKIEV